MVVKQKYMRIGFITTTTQNNKEVPQGWKAASVKIRLMILNMKFPIYHQCIAVLTNVMIQF